MVTRTSTARRGRTSKDDYFPTILSSEELMALVLSSPEVLELRSIVQFPNFVPGSYSFQDFLETFVHNDTTHTIRCSRHFTTGFSDDQFCQILRAMSQLRQLRRVVFVDGGDSRLRQLRLTELARLIHSVPQLQTVVLGRYWLLTGDDGERLGLARALAHHPSLQTFHYAGCGVKPPSQQHPQRPTAAAATAAPTSTTTSTIQLYQAIAPRSDPDAVLVALATCPVLRSVRITHSPYCARDYSIPALGRLACGRNLRDCAMVTKVAQWAPLLDHFVGHHNDSSNVAGAAPTTCSLLQRLVLITAEHGLTSVDTLGPLAGPLRQLPVRQLSLRFWGGPFCALSHTMESVAQALRVNPYLRLLEVSEGRTIRDDTNNYEDKVDGDDDDDDNNQNDDTERDILYGANVPLRMILPVGSHAGSLSGFDLDTLTATLCGNPNLQIRLDVGIAAVDQDALDRLKLQSNLNAVRLVLLSSTTNEAVAPAEEPHELLLTVSTTLERLCRNDDPVFGLTCWYGFLRNNPLVWCQR